MSIAALDILHRLADLGATVERQDDKLMVRAGTTPVPRAVLATIREHKAEVLAVLAAPASPVAAEAAQEEQVWPWYSRTARKPSGPRWRRMPGFPLPSLAGTGPRQRGGGYMLRASQFIRCPGRTHTAAWCGTTIPTISPTRTS